MSQGNVEIVQRGYEAFARGDIDAALSALDPEIEVRPAPDFPGEDSYHGRAGFLAYTGQWLESWDEYWVIPEQFIDAGDQVVVPYRAVGRGRGSGIDVETRLVHVWTIREGKVVRMEIFSEFSEALEAAGLREDPPESAGPTDLSAFVIHVTNRTPRPRPTA
jgi:uncharacterized protein